MMKKSDIKKKYVFSVLLAFFAVVPTLNQILVRVYPNTSGILYTLLYTVSIVLIVLAFVLFGLDFKKLSPSSLILLLACILAYFFTSYSSFRSTLNISFFAIFTICSFLVTTQVRVDPKTFLQAVMIIPSFGILYIDQVFETNWRGSIHMDTSYSFVLPLVSTVFYAAYYWSKEKKNTKRLMILFFAINAYYFFILLFRGSRAPSLSIVLASVFAYVSTINSNRSGFKFKKNRIVLMMIPIILIVFSFSSILLGLGSFAENNDIKAGTIQKSINLAKSGNLDDGRINLSDDVWDAIKRSPLYGNGLSTSLESCGQVHPHNFILQLLHDGGLLLMLIFMIPMLVYLRKWKQKCTYDGFILISLFFFSSVIGALFSLDMWMNSRLWMFMGFFLSDDLYDAGHKILKYKKYGLNSNTQLQ